MNWTHPSQRFRARWTGWLAIAATTVAAGCGAGQITQTSSAVSAVNGSSLELGHMQLHNIYLDRDPGDPVDRVRLAFTAINTSSSVRDRLVAIESPAATDVTILASPAALTLLPGTALAAGQPIEHLTEPAAPDQPITVQVTIPGGVRPGLTTPFTFVFDRAGAGTATVPVDVWAPGEDVPASRDADA